MFVFADSSRSHRLRSHLPWIVAGVISVTVLLAASPAISPAHAGGPKGCASLNRSYAPNVNVARVSLSETVAESFDTISATVTLASPAPRTPDGGVYVYNTYGQGAEFVSDACAFVPTGKTRATYNIYTRTSTGPATAVSYTTHTDGTVSKAEARFTITAKN